ncbi:Bug family tripartite tricarboxylate transporter substrate binding protein [Bordetella flabilis]|uniref:Bug family tripartite tricarboxylate transporter substrate binding protein n=1 Tax=Bordetella flabilis TaxID=463014 RepID=UPI000A0720CF|nr:tripartite tricarboxylate transporter substrate binding protein [Bordetella flabilis]
MPSSACPPNGAPARPSRRSALRRAGAYTAGLAGLGLAGLTFAQSTAPLHLLVAYPPGGSADILARLLAQYLGPVLGRSVVVDNRPGAGGMLGLNVAVQSPPDGNTIFLCPVTTLIIGTELNKNARNDVVRDLEPVSLLASAPHVLATNTHVPAQDMESFIAWLRKNGPSVNYASGYGTLSHLEGVLLQQRLGVQLTNVPYKGSAQAMTDLLAGSVSFIFDSIPSALPFIRSGQLRGLAVASSRRVPALSQLPTLKEAGVPGYDVDNWFGICAPKGTPPAAIQTLDQAFAGIMADPKLDASLEQNGYLANYANAATLRDVSIAETRKWGELIKAANISL